MLKDKHKLIKVQIHIITCLCMYVCKSHMMQDMRLKAFTGTLVIAFTCAPAKAVKQVEQQV